MDLDEFEKKIKERAEKMVEEKVAQIRTEKERQLKELKTHQEILELQNQVLSAERRAQAAGFSTPRSSRHSRGASVAAEAGAVGAADGEEEVEEQEEEGEMDQGIYDVLENLRMTVAQMHMESKKEIHRDTEAERERKEHVEQLFETARKKLQKREEESPGAESQSSSSWVHCHTTTRSTTRFDETSHHRRPRYSTTITA